MLNINKNVVCINPASISNKIYFVHCSLILCWTQDYIKRIWKHKKFNCLTHALGQGSQIKQHEIGTKIKQFRRWLRENEFEHHQGLNEITWNNSTIPCPHGKRHSPGENDTPVPFGKMGIQLTPPTPRGTGAVTTGTKRWNKALHLAPLADYSNTSWRHS